MLTDLDIKFDIIIDDYFYLRRYNKNIKLINK